MFCHFKISREKYLCRASGKGECKMFMLSQVYTDHVYLAKERESDCSYKNVMLTLRFGFHTAHSWVKCHITLYTVTLGTA